jgi:hypothetical protein
MTRSEMATTVALDAFPDMTLLLSEGMKGDAVRQR